MKTNRVRRLNIRDHSLTKIAELAKKDVMYCRMVEHLKRGTKLEMIEEDCELRQLRGDIQHIGLFNTEAGPLIERNSFTVLIPEKGRQTILDELHSTHISVWNIWQRFLLPLPTPFRMVKNHFFEVTQNRL